MKTRKQVLADFYDMQKQLFAERGYESVSVQTYNNETGDYWYIGFRVCHYDLTKNKHDLWEQVEWEHHSRHDEEDERENLAKVAEFKSKFGLR